MERREIEELLTSIETEKDGVLKRGNYSTALYQTIAQLVIADQLMKLVEQNARPKVDHRQMAENLIEDIEEALHVDDPEQLLQSVTRTLEKAYD